MLFSSEASGTGWILLHLVTPPRNRLPLQSYAHSLSRAFPSPVLYSNYIYSSISLKPPLKKPLTFLLSSSVFFWSCLAPTKSVNMTHFLSNPLGPHVLFLSGCAIIHSIHFGRVPYLNGKVKGCFIHKIKDCL